MERVRKTHLYTLQQYAISPKDYKRGNYVLEVFCSTVDDLDTMPSLQYYP